MRTMKVNQIIVLLAVAGMVLSGAAQSAGPSLGLGTNDARYATDAYPGFDVEEDNVKPERKEPRWWWFLCGGPARETATEQFAYCRELLTGGSSAAACRQLDNLVRQWPTSPEAWQAQQLLAETLLEKCDDAEESFKEYRYLLDFYSLQCDYGVIADKLYEVAGILKLEGKSVMFVRFANTVDVRRYHEMCVLRAPGAKWVPEAMLTIASLREDEGKNEEAVKVYENLRNLYPESGEAKRALAREAAARVVILNECEYNRARCQDTINYLQMALRNCPPEDASSIRQSLEDARLLLEEECYRSAKFYDSTTRTKRSAVSAYEKFLEEYPQSSHTEEVRARLEVLKGCLK